MNVIVKEKPAKKTKPEAVAEMAVLESQSSFENALILRAIDMRLGMVKTNIDTVLVAVREKVQQYTDVAKYDGDDKQAKADRALLRKQKELAKTTIASLQEAWNKPMEEVLSGGKEIVKQFDIAIEAIDEWVKEGEAQEKEKKHKVIQAYFDSKGFDLVPLEMIFNNKWLNKTFDIRDIKKDIDNIIMMIYSNIKILESVAEYGMTAKAFYLETLDMGSAMRKVETLKENAERLAQEKIEREERERQAQLVKNASEERWEKEAEEIKQEVKSLAAEALDLSEPELPLQSAILEFTLRIQGKKEQLFKLREYMTANKISYIKL